jgi:hypothetical protein
MNILSLLGQSGLGALGAAGQKKAGEFAYRVYRLAEKAKTANQRTKAIPVEWIDLTQREQERWIAAVGDAIEEGREIR